MTKNDFMFPLDNFTDLVFKYIIKEPNPKYYSTMLKCLPSRNTK